MFDIDFGTFLLLPSTTITAGVCSGLGIAPHHIKAMCLCNQSLLPRVAAGLFPQNWKRNRGGAKKDRGMNLAPPAAVRCGWIDLVALNFCLHDQPQRLSRQKRMLDAFENLEVCTAYNLNGKKAGSAISDGKGKTGTGIPAIYRLAYKHQ